MTNLDHFVRIFFERIEKTKQLCDLYVDNPNRKNTHNLRTSIKRLDTAYSIIPKSCKTKSSDLYVKQLKQIFSINSKVRDYDIIYKKLIEYGIKSDSDILLGISKKKGKKISKAVKASILQLQFKKPKIKTNSRTIARFEQRIVTIIDAFERYAPIVVHDETMVEELHTLRKIVKKLRYTLEAGQKQHNEIITKLKKLQDILGNIHDCDIFIWYLDKKRSKHRGLSQIIETEKLKRKNNYEKLVLTLANFGTIS